MWYPGTEIVGPWCKTDRIENIVLQPPQYWAHIFPPNNQAQAQPPKVTLERKESEL
jgi:hypothetical protein